MAIIQALLALISKSAGKILNAIFGWAVHALFGRTSSRDQTLLSALVGAAVAWPLLLAGIAAPKIAALVLAFVPLPHWVPSWTVRLVWLVLALGVPVALGLTLGARRPAHAQAEPYPKRVLRGFPITLGLAVAFLLMFVSVPLMRLVAIVRRQKSADVPLVTDVDAYHEVAARVVEALNRHDFALRATDPSWWVKAPTRILSFFGGKAFAGFVPQRIEHFTGPGLDVSFYTSGILLRGAGPRVTWAHGLIAETAVHSSGLETMAGPAQDIEREIRRLWKVVDVAPEAHANAEPLLARVRELARELGTITVEYEEWSVLYRQLLQVERAVRGDRQLLDESSKSTPETTMTNTKTDTTNEKKNADAPAPRVPEGGDKASARGPEPALARSLRGPAESLSTPELLKEITHQATRLVTAQVDLAKAELRADLSREATMVAGIGVAALAGITTVNLLLVTAILALSAVLPAWGAGLCVSGAVLLFAAIAGALGWNKRVKTPLERTRRELDQDVKFTKERVA
jgi:Putative Actinobacterial Holin-X, holin superfamily III